MKKKTKKLMKQLGKSKKQKNREAFLEERAKKFPAKKRDGGAKKNSSLLESRKRIGLRTIQK